MDTFTIFSGVASIIGLGISIYLIFLAKKISHFFGIQFRVPKLCEKIDRNIFLIGNTLFEYNPSNVELRKELAECLGNLKSLKRNTPWSEKAKIKKTINSIDKSLKEMSIDEISTRRIHTDLVIIVTSAKNWRSDFFTEVQQ